MGTGWRRALCTSVQRDDGDAKNKKRRPHDAAGGGGGGFFSAVKSAATGNSSSNPSTPTLRCRTKPLQQPAEAAPVTPPSAPAPARKHRMPLLQALSAPASPRSPSRFALLKASLLPSKARCGVCSRGVKSGGSSAVFTAECSHAFHFPCIAAHARSSSANGVLSCPVCAEPWRQAPFLASLRLHCSSFHDDNKRRASGGSDGRKTPPPPPSSKLYDDDEPLLAPKAAANGGGFNPIPEADEDDEEEEQGAAEFRGFFPRPRTTSGLAVTVAPEAALVSTGRRHGKYVVAVKVKAPGLRLSSASPRRAPIDLVTVLDVSQGMMGEKLQILKRGMRLVVASLGPADRLSIVAFSGAAKRLLPLRRMTRQGQRSARQILDRLVVCAAAATTQGQEQGPGQQQSACVGDALRKATKVLEDRRDRNPVATVMLLSDTQQQQQQRDQSTTRKQFGRPAMAAPATRFTHVEIPIGDAPPLVRPEEEKEEPPVEHAFARCLGGLVSVVMQDVQLELVFLAGEITAVYSCGPGQQAVALAGGGSGGAGVSVRLGEMYAEEERELLVELRAPLQQQSHHPHSLSVRCGYRDPASQEAVRGAEQPLLLPPLAQSERSSRRLHDLFVVTRAVAESRRLAELQDLATAIHLLSSARALVLQSPPTQQREELVGSLDTELSDMQWRRSQQQQHRHQQEDDQQPLTPTSRRGRRPDGEAAATTPVGTPRSGGPGGEPLTPTSAWRAAEQLAKVAIMRKSMNRVSDLHGFENARF
ncbi:hypothetical protein SETIT_7G003000v2 [Setaria italica]|uniref:RING-type domain-containing protein n=1 Tax=Setaria italica TaxID=4555 RepID=K3Y5F4_SETIT|nr:uncharacterized protein LOC101763175 [Setaria italica]RCV32439.1 hypothetical protein SETIT_7G003000v2 [Setaria italica]